MSALTKQLANLAADAKGAAALVSSISESPDTTRGVLLPACQSVVNRLASELSAVADYAAGGSIAAAPIEHPTRPHIDGALDMTAGIDLALATTNDLLSLAVTECNFLGNSATRVDSAIRAIYRFLDDVSKLNRTLQTELRHLELIAEAQERARD